MKKIIVTGHAHFSTGLQSTMELLAGKNEDVFFVDFVEGFSDLDLKEKFEEIINENLGSEFLFFCDLVGGTPYKTAATLAFGNPALEVVAGCNIGSLIEILFTKENFSNSDLARKIVSISNDATSYFEKEIYRREEDFELDGI